MKGNKLMLETVVECLVKSKLTGKEYAKRIGMILLDVILMFAGIVLILKYPFVIFLFPFVILLMCIFTYLVFRNTNIEYEYSFFDGEMVIDRIMGRKVRKRVRTFNFAKMDYMAPEGSSHIRTGNSNRKVYDYSSHDSSQNNYVAVLYDDANGVAELKFTPNEELIERLQRSYARKIYSD
ncbi:MAG: DUF6106 family protein [Butyrivibrio sp.]